MLDRLLNQSATPLLERTASFHSARHAVLAENVVNLSTPGYRQKDLNEASFRSRLRDRVAAARRDGTVDYSYLAAEPAETSDDLVFHDGNDRSVEELITEQAKNALQHNMAVELLRKQYALFDLALRERVG